MIDPNTPTDGWSYVADCQCDRCTVHHHEGCERCGAASAALDKAASENDDVAYAKAAESFCDEGTHVEPGHEAWASDADLGMAEREPVPTTTAHYQGDAVTVPRVPRRRP